VGAAAEANESDVVAVEPPPSALVMTRPDGSTYEFDDLTITCDPSLAMGGDAACAGGRVYLSSPILVAGQKLRQPFVLLEAEVGEAPRTFTLPLADAGGPEQPVPLSVFMADPEGAPDGNEVVGAGSSTGTVTVTRASCDPEPVLELEVDATLSSEEQTEDGQAKQSLVLQGVVR